MENGHRVVDSLGVDKFAGNFKYSTTWVNQTWGLTLKPFSTVYCFLFPKLHWKTVVHEIAFLFYIDMYSVVVIKVFHSILDICFTDRKSVV